MVSSSPPLGFIFKAPNPGICQPPPALAPGLGGLGSSSRIPMFSKPSVRTSLESAWVGIERSHLSYGTLRPGRNIGHCGFAKGDNDDRDNWSTEQRDGLFSSGSSEDSGLQIPTQAQTLVEGSATVAVSEYKPTPDIDYLMELLAIQQQGPRPIGFFGTRNMGFMHQQLIEILSYAMVITKNHIFTSGASGTNAAVIRGALRAEKPELLTVILPQSLKMQPPESQELLAKVQNLIEKPENDQLPLIEASRKGQGKAKLKEAAGGAKMCVTVAWWMRSVYVGDLCMIYNYRLCNMDILSKVQQVICFAFHDSKLLMETCEEAKKLRKIVTLFYLD